MRLIYLIEMLIVNHYCQNIHIQTFPLPDLYYLIFDMQQHNTNLFLHTVHVSFKSGNNSYTTKYKLMLKLKKIKNSGISISQQYVKRVTNNKT